MDHPKTWQERLSINLAGSAENLILLSRWLLYPLYAVSLFLVFPHTIDAIRLLFGTVSETTLNDHTINGLKILDSTMIANLIWLISSGSYYVFIDNKGINSGKKRPRCLEHISAGILKEKMAGSIVGVSSVLLLQYFLHLADPGVKLDWRLLGAMLAIHVAFILGLIAFNYCNAADHHDHSNEKEPTKETPHAS